MNFPKRKEATGEAKVEGRQCVRFAVPGAIVYVNHGSGQLKGDSTEYIFPVVDVSKGGISFLSKTMPRTGRVSLLLHYSENEEAIPLEGRIVYIVPSPSIRDYPYRVGVEFIPFSAKRGLNSPGAFSKLDRLEKKYAEEHAGHSQGGLANRPIAAGINLK